MRLFSKIILICTLIAQVQAQTHPFPFISALNGWETKSLFTIGESVNGFQPVGLFDGMGAISLNDSTFRVFVNHEASSFAGNKYRLSNGAKLTGARVSFFDINMGDFKVVDGGNAIKEIINAAGDTVKSGFDLGNAFYDDGMHRFCSGKLIEKGTNNLENTLFFAGEERQGGKEFALDVNTGTFYEIPALGKAGFENITLLKTGEENHVAVVIGDDRPGSPLLLYVGLKNANGGLLDRNGLKNGELFVWVADDGAKSPADFKGTGVSKAGKFVKLNYFDPAQKGVNGYDSLGFATQSKQDELTQAAGAYRFSRPEDVSTNPFNGQQVVYASTGKGDQFADDDYGVLCVIQFNLDDLKSPKATIKIVYDGDDAGNGQFDGPDYGLRSPDNNEWLSNGYVVVQEDNSVKTNQFGQPSGRETSIWEHQPFTDQLTRIAEINRSVTLPNGQADNNAGIMGAWETSGIIDVSTVSNFNKDSIILLSVIQAHGVQGGNIGTDSLIEGAQLVLLKAKRKEQLYCNPYPTSTTNLSLCKGDSVKIGGIFRKDDGTYTDTVGSSNGCDTIKTINLSFNNCTSGINDSHDYFSIYPNPAVNEVYISVNNISDQAPVGIKVFTLSGKLFYARKVTSKGGFLLYKINTSRWKSGMYKINLKSEIHQMNSTILINK